MSRKSAGLFLHTPVGVSLPMNTKKGHALFPILKTDLFWEETRIAAYFISRWKPKGAPWMFVAATRNTVRWIIQSDHDAQDLVQEACKLMISTPTSGLNAAQLTDGRDGFQEGTPKIQWEETLDPTGQGQQSNALDERPVLLHSPSGNGCVPSPIWCTV